MNVQTAMATAVRGLPDDALANLVRELDDHSVCWLAQNALTESLNGESEDVEPAQPEPKAPAAKRSRTKQLASNAILEDEIVKVVRKAGKDGMKGPAIRDELGLTKDKCTYLLKKLRVQGRLAREGNNTAAIWTVA